MAASLRASAESSLPPTPSTLASLRISTDTWSQLPDSPARLPTAAVGGGSGQWTSQQLLAAELEARNQALRRILAPGGGRESTNQDVARSQHPSAAPAAPVSRAVDHVFEMMEAKKLRTVDLFRDRDGGGAVDAAELRADFDRHGVRLSHEDAKGLFGALDQDGNGEVDKREFVEQMRLLKNARRGAAASPRLEPEPEPEPEPQQIPRQQRARTSRAPKVRPRPLSPRTAAASASRLSRTGAAAAPAAARTRPAASSAGGGLPPWLPGGTSVRSSASSARSGVESASLSAQAARGSRGPGGSSSRANAAAGRAGGARPSRGGGRSSTARRPRPAWASPPPTPTAAAADSEGGTGEHAVGAVVLQAMEDRNLRALDLFHALDRDSSGTIDQDELQGALVSTLGLELGVNELQELLTTLDKVRTRMQAQNATQTSPPAAKVAVASPLARSHREFIHQLTLSCPGLRTTTTQLRTGWRREDPDTRICPGDSARKESPCWT
jgi:Ca2+-binding EF-hand superfamily protein